MILFFTFSSAHSPISHHLPFFICLVLGMQGEVEILSFCLFVCIVFFSPHSFYFLFSPRLTSHWGNSLGQNFVNRIPIRIENLRMNNKSI